MESDENLVFSKEETYALIDKIFVEIEERDDAFLEIDKQYFKIVQLGPYRTVIVYPPLSDGLELTIVKPVKLLTIEDYDLDEKVMNLLKEDAKGVLIAGAPGSGKSTFAQAVLEMHLAQGKITKTIESPRDLMVDDKVVQYSFSYGSHDDLRDILLLSRPDYTVYDEVRNVPDFELFKDLRLTGIGLLGVIHATKPIDGVQRFLGHIEMGIIPQMIDTVIFIDKGSIGAIYTLALTVKVPAGMNSEELARPVVQVSNFETGEVEYEIYTFGEQIVVIPTDSLPEEAMGASAVQQHAQQAISDKLHRLFNFDFMLSVKGDKQLLLYVPAKNKASVIGSGGSKIQTLEKELGMSISVKSFDELPLTNEKFRTNISGKNKKAVISFETLADQKVHLIVGDEIVPVMVDKK